MTNNEVLIVLIFVGLFTIIISQEMIVIEKETQINELLQDQSSFAYHLDTCQGQVIAFNKAFDYHVVMSELGLYPQIKEDLYLNKGKGGK